MEGIERGIPSRRIDSAFFRHCVVFTPKTQKQRRLSGTKAHFIRAFQQKAQVFPRKDLHPLLRLDLLLYI